MRDRNERSKRGAIGVAQPGWGLKGSLMVVTIAVEWDLTVSGIARQTFEMDQICASYADNSPRTMIERPCANVVLRN